ncbi:serine/threonine-protein kinase [Streptomyces sp. NBC_00878]|uniref:serine/threonine-protein kinase n=1 Tax=Streptomyces sp. NBC_00878 TaxID=2975854 RepID=UPI00224EF288|nr:serine/threonine-protein kinase [Streptomyces sp. NBC_00878]MCX4907942.1 PQQ-binding-like beta-propeller repeat protein [Streptomyces sp. NBC_00878]
METLQPDDPRELGSYRLLRRLGAGGMGRVYLARSPGGRTVAVKVVRQDLAADVDFRRRFQHEVEIARAVSGRYTAPVVDAAPDAALPWLATSYVLGPDLTDLVEAHGALAEHTVRALGAGLAAALQEIHAVGLIHRDLKPSNVLLAADGPRVIDFGIARAVDGNRMTQTGVVVGSPGYLPPEQALGQDVGTAGDVFSLGAVLAFAATGRNAFGEGAASHAAMLYQVVHGEPDVTGIPQSLLGLIRACLQKDPTQRPAPAEIVAALAPGGVEKLLTNWLPSAVASTIATHAAAILDLEAPETPEAQPTPGFGRPPTMLDGTSTATGTPGTGTPIPGYGYGTPPSGSAPYATGGPLPGTVQVGTTLPDAAPASSRRRFLGLATAGVAGVVVAGGGAAWWLTQNDADADDGASRAADNGGTAEPAAEKFTTPPAGTAPQPLWHKSVAEDSISTTEKLLTHDGLLLVNGDPLVAYDVKTGKQRWSRKDVLPFGAPLLLADGKLFMADTDTSGVLKALDVTTGKEAWRSRLGKDLKVEKTIAVDAKNVYVTVTDFSDSRSVTDYRTGVAAISHGTGKKVWLQKRDWGTNDYDVEGTASGRQLVYADSNYNLTVRDTATGTQMWTRKVGDDWTWRPTVAPGAGLVFLPGDNLTAVDVETGKPRWTISPNGRRGFDNPTVIDGVLYTADHDGGVWAIDVKTGRKLWLCEDPGADSAPTQFLRVGETLYGASGMDGGGVFALGAKSGRARWVYNENRGTGEPWQVAVSGNRLLATHGYEIYALPAV